MGGQHFRGAAYRGSGIHCNLRIVLGQETEQTLKVIQRAAGIDDLCQAYFRKALGRSALPSRARRSIHVWTSPAL